MEIGSFGSCVKLVSVQLLVQNPMCVYTIWIAAKFVFYFKAAIELVFWSQASILNCMGCFLKNRFSSAELLEIFYSQY
jgi:hypothetical protein